MAEREFYVLIEQDENGGFKGDVPQLRSCRSKGKTLDELLENTRKAIELNLSTDDLNDCSEVIGIYKIEVQTQVGVA